VHKGSMAFDLHGAAPIILRGAARAQLRR
jgi:hypothetical protein